MLSQLYQRKSKIYDYTKEEIDVPKNKEYFIKKIVSKKGDLFASKNSNVDGTNTVKMKIETKDYHLMNNRSYRVINWSISNDKVSSFTTSLYFNEETTVDDIKTT